MIEVNPYYEVNAISNSGLSYINLNQGGHPKKYQRFIINKEEKFEQTPSMERGTLLHSWIENQDNFVVSDVIRPSDMAVSWVEGILRMEKMFPNLNFNQLIVDTKTELDIYKTIKDKDKMIAKFREDCMEFYLELKNPSGKHILTKDTKRIVDACCNSIYFHPLAHDLLFYTPIIEDPDLEIFKEFPIYFKHIGEDCKALLDRVIIDHKKKEIKIIDLKTTSKPVGRYFDAFFYWHTYRQLAFYKLAVNSYKESRPELKGYKIVPIIIAVETFGQFTPMVIKIDDSWIDEGTKEVANLMGRIRYHKERDSWDMTMEEYMGANKFVYDKELYPIKK